MPLVSPQRVCDIVVVADGATNNGETDMANETEAKREKRTNRAILDKSGEWFTGKTMPTDPIAVKIEVLGEQGGEVIVKLEELPANILNSAAAFGLKTMLTNLGKGDDNSYSAEAIEDCVERLMAGHWSQTEGRGGLPGAKIVLDALETVYRNAGKSIDRDALKAKLASLNEDDYKATLKSWSSQSAVKIEIERLREDARQRRLAALGEKAKTETLIDLD